ncbi:MAG TPA: dihydrofolate reductase family protein [Kofleriaceae bacterium]
MRRCSVFIATSLDGYIARSDGGIDWLAIVARAGEDYGYAKFMANVDVILIGRATFDTAAGFAEWPYPGKRVVVATHRPQPSIHGEVYACGEPAQLLADLGPARRIYIDGGSLITQFLAADLIDDLRIAILPIVLGNGVRLFRGGEGEHRLELTGHRVYPSGLVALEYHRPPR